MKVYPVQNRFTAGEISPKLHSRSDIEGYSAGCKTLENFIALRHGSIERRDGTRIVSTHAGYRAKLFEFPISDTLAFCATFSSNGFLYLDDRDGNLHGDNLVANPNFPATLIPGLTEALVWAMLTGSMGEPCSKLDTLAQLTWRN